MFTDVGRDMYASYFILIAVGTSLLRERQWHLYLELMVIVRLIIESTHQLSHCNLLSRLSTASLILI